MAAVVACLGRGAVRWRINKGRWQQPRREVIVTHSGPLKATQQLWVDLLASGPGAVLAGLTAACCDGLRGFTAEATHILVPFGRKVVRRSGIVVHHSRRLGLADIHPARLPPRTQLPRSLIDAASWAATDNRARGILAAGVQQRLVRVADLRTILDHAPTLPRRRLIRLTLDDIAGGAQALSEIDFIRLVRRYRLPEPDQQAVRQDENGRRRWLDAYFSRWGIVVEVDGFWHTDADAWWADMDRSNKLTVAGMQVLRFPSFVVRERPEYVAREIAKALRLAGWPG